MCSLAQAVKNLGKERAAELAAEEAKRLTDEGAKVQEQLKTDLTNTKRQLETTEERLKAVEAAKKEIE